MGVFAAGALAEAAGVAAGGAVVDFTGVVAGAAPVGVVAAVAGAAAVDFFERLFFGVVALSAVALLSAASAFFEVLFFEDAVPASGASCEAEASATAFFFCGAGVTLGLIAGLLRRLRPDRDVTCNEQEGREQGDVHTFYCSHSEVILSPKAADPSCRTHSRECGWVEQVAFKCASRVFLGGMGA